MINNLTNELFEAKKQLNTIPSKIHDSEIDKPPEIPQIKIKVPKLDLSFLDKNPKEFFNHNITEDLKDQL